MAGAEREITDPVEAAKFGIGSSKRLIATTLDDLSDHHSWLVTYHRDERLRAERLRRRALRDRLERRYRSIAATANHGIRTTYVEGRRAARFSRRRGHALAHWAAPRLKIFSRHVTETAVILWHAGRQHTPVVASRASAAIRDGFNWSVEASEQAGHVFRAHASELAANTSDEVLRQSTPLRRRANSEWARTLLWARRIRTRGMQRAADWMAASQMLAQLRRTSRRGTVFALRFGRPLAERTRSAAVRLEDALSAHVLRIAPAFRQFLNSHMPSAPAPVNANCQLSRALILRPTTALICIAPEQRKLPVLFRT